MIRNKIEVEIILTDTGRIKIKSNGAIYSISEFSPLAAGLEVDLLYSLGINGKMDIKVGDRIKSGDVLGTVTKSSEYDAFITVLCDDDKKELSVNRKYVEKIQNPENENN